MQIESILFNETGRLRSGWRFACFLFLFIFFNALFAKSSQEILSTLPIGFSPNSFLAMLVGSIIPLIIAIFAGWLCGRFLEGLPFKALGAWFTKGWLKDLVLGLVLGALTLSLAVLIGVIFGGLRFQFNEAAGQSAILITLGVSFAIFFFAAAFEEALFRGYMLQTFTRAGLAWFAIAMTSVFFGLVHASNPNVTTFAIINTMLAGIWFSVAYLKTRTLWLAFGLHFIWNWMLGAFYGIEVSGLTDITTAPVLVEFDRGPVWLTGENYGIEGSISCTIALVVSTLLIWFLPIFKPTEEMLELTSKENPSDKGLTVQTQKRGDQESHYLEEKKKDDAV